MARLPRLALANHAHWVSQRGHSARQVFADATDRQAYLAAVHEAARAGPVMLHAYALLDREVHLLASPPEPEALSRLMQAVGRRYVSAYNRRYGGSGTLWEGRFRCAVVEPGAALLEVLCLIDGLATGSGSSSLPHRSSDVREPGVTDPPEFWALGNTPFERQALWRQRVQEGVPAATSAALMAAARGGWAIGSEGFKAQVAEAAARPAAPRPRGRPANRSR